MESHLGNNILRQQYAFTNRKVYSESDYDCIEENRSTYYKTKCDFSPQEVSNTPPVFDYSRFSEFLRMKSRIEYVNRIAEASEGIISPGLDYYDDDKLKEELHEIYGHMDESHERFKLIFEEYKDLRLEQIQQWIKDAEENKELSYQFLNESEELLNYFTLDEISTFQLNSTDPFIEPFVLPRNLVASDSTNLPVVNPDPGLKQPNPNQVLSSQVAQIMEEHPLGITHRKLIQKCNQRLSKFYGKKLNKSTRCIPNLTLEIIKKDLSKVVFTRDFRDDYLVFPVIFQPVILQSPLKILWNFRHKLLCVLNLSYGIIPIDDCIALCNKIFNMNRFRFEDWGFMNDLDFVEWLFKNWKTRDNVEVIESKSNGGNQKSKYLAVMTDEMQKFLGEKNQYPSPGPVVGVPSTNLRNIYSTSVSQIEKRDNSSSTLKSHSAKGSFAKPLGSFAQTIKSAEVVTKSSPVWTKPLAKVNPVSMQTQPMLNFDPMATSISPQYVQIGDTVRREQNDISPRESVECVVALINSPTGIYLVRKTRWRELEKLFHELKDLWDNSPQEFSPHPKFLQKHYICMAKTEQEVYRVVILGKSEEHYKVFCVDYGDTLTIHHDNLRFLPKDYMNVLPAQCISCSLYNVASKQKDPSGNEVWSNAVCEYTRKLFNAIECDMPIVKVLFMQKVLQTGKWLVKVSAGKPEKDFGESIMKFVNK